MIKQLSDSLSEIWAKTGVIQKSKRKLYQYGLELLLSSVANLLLLLLISSVAGHPFVLIPYLFSFVILRIFSGGYHTKNHWSCILLTGGIYSVFLIYSVITKESDGTKFCTTVSTISFLILMRYSPIQSDNKPLEKWEVERYGAISKIIGGILFAFSFLFVCIKLTNNLPVKMLYAGEAVAALLQMAAVIQNKQKSH